MDSKSRFFIPLSKTLILQKCLFFLRKINVFLIWSLQKSIKIRYRNDFKKNIEIKASEIWFLGPCWPPKTSKIGLKSDVKRSLFRDAMELTRKSSEINGGCDIWTAKMALHMIRSTLSAPRCPNHQSNFFNLKRFTHVSPNAMRDWKKRFWRLKNHLKSNSEGLKIHPKSSSKT